MLLLLWVLLVLVLPVPTVSLILRLVILELLEPIHLIDDRPSVELNRVRGLAGKREALMRGTSL